MIPTIFARAGVNPQSMNPAISGDSFLHVRGYGFSALVGVVDGAWVKGFDKPAIAMDIAAWSSQTIVTLLESEFRNKPYRVLANRVRNLLPAYSARVEVLKQDVGYAVTPPEPYTAIDPRKIGPQSAFALVQFNPDGSADIAQARDCLVVAEHADGRMERLTPNQSELVAAASQYLDVQHESPNKYQGIMREVHKPAFFNAARDLLDTLCLCHNSHHFLNNPDAPVVTHEGQQIIASWAMFTGEESMLPLMFTRNLSPNELDGIAALWLMSDGAFKQGDRGADLQAMRALGPEAYYTDVLLKRFDNSAPGRNRFHPERVPMDVTIVRVPL